jgi:D-alanyl-D-alanine carboxypeptidase
LSLRRFVTTNQLLGSYRWTVGGKTGFTNRAGRCLVASASRGGRRLVAVTLGSPNAFADVQALFEYGFSGFVRVRLARRGQPVSLAPGRPAELQATADVDALVRLDHLTRVRLVPSPGPAGGTTADGGASAWLVGGGRRLVRLPLAPAAAGTAPTATPTAPVPSGTAPPTSAAASTETAPGSGGPSGATLVAGTVVRVWAVPPGAAVPVIDPFLRRAAR